MALGILQLRITQGPILKMEGQLAILRENQSETDHECRGSCLNTSSTVIITSDPSRKTRKVSSAHRWKTPVVPELPIPSTMSGVMRNGTRSGIGKSLPCRRDQIEIPVSAEIAYLVKSDT